MTATRLLKEMDKTKKQNLELTWEDDGNIVIITSLSSATSKGVFLVGTPMPAKIFMASPFLKGLIFIQEHKCAWYICQKLNAPR